MICLLIVELRSILSHVQFTVYTQREEVRGYTSYINLHKHTGSEDNVPGVWIERTRFFFSLNL